MKYNLLKKMYLVAIMLSSSVIFAQTISGTISDNNGPLPGASVVVKGTTNGVSSDFDGNFTLENVASNAVLVVSYLGYVTQEINVAGQSVINVALVEDASQLDEVVVTSLGLTRAKKSLGYSVTQLDGSDVSTVKEVNVASSLVGKVAGVVVSKSTSGPGGATRIVIRGNNSLSGNNQPLYVVDGVPINNGGIRNAEAGEYIVPDLGTGISDINPDDIESITVLKGPNAAALYGSRASNGVILITTKRGTIGKGLGVSYSSSVTFDDPLVLPKYQNEYGRGKDGNFVTIIPSDPLSTQVNAVMSAGSWGPKYDGSQQLEFNGKMRAYTAQPDNVKDFFETGTTFINTLALNGGTEKASIYFSSTNSDISSILPNSTLKRNNFNLRGYSKLSDKLTLDTKVTYFLQGGKNRPDQGTEGIAAYIWELPRNVSLSDLRVYQDLDNPINPENPYGVIAPRTLTGNPYWVLFNDFNEDKRSRITGFAKLDYEFTDYLSAFVRVGHDAVSHNTKIIVNTGHHFYPGGELRYGKNNSTETNYDFLLMFNKDLNEKFNLVANAGGNMRHADFINSTTFGFDFKIPGKHFLENTDGLKIEATQSDLIQKKVHSLYGNASLSYDNTLYLDVTARNDWSSALAAKNRSYFYSSVNLSVLLHRLIDLGDTIDFLKLRASTANVGNDTDAHQIVNLFGIAGTGYLGNIQVNRDDIKLSEDLKPEDVRSTDIGFEFKAFKNRLYGEFSYYDISSKNLIMDIPLPSDPKFEFFRTNVGEMTNKGFELLIGGTPVENDNFTWDTSFNISKNENKLASLVEGTDLFPFSQHNDGVVDVRATVGGGFGDIYTTDWLRNDAGQLIVTAEGHPQATGERVLIGNYQPDLTGGFSNNFRYKNFTLRTLIDFRIGGEVYSGTDAGLDRNGVSERTLQYRESGIVVDGVVDDGNDNFTQNTTSISAQDYWGAVSGIGSEYVYDQTNIRMREISLTYNMPSRYLENTFIQKLALSAIGRNLFFIDKKVENFDPESSYSSNVLGQGVLFYALPTTRSIGFSLNVNF